MTWATELLAVKLALKEWLEGAKHPFIVWTDHKNLSEKKNLFIKRISEEPTTSSETLPCSVCLNITKLDITGGNRRKQLGHNPHTPALSACPKDKLYVPDHLHAQVLQWCHSSWLTCHPRTARTRVVVRQRFWWPTSRHQRVCCSMPNMQPYILSKWCMGTSRPGKGVFSTLCQSRSTTVSSSLETSPSPAIEVSPII